MVGLEHQVHLLSAQVQRLQFENSSLANQNELLSKVLVMKEGQVKVLRHESKVSLYVLCVIVWTLFDCMHYEYIQDQPISSSEEGLKLHLRCGFVSQSLQATCQGRHLVNS